ncbi:MAG: hypothetical protein L0Y60_14950 [Beijerinckiaceae bacterium]|nr:hypothetical protein [Beijerinckiaceae bacterium]
MTITYPDDRTCLEPEKTILDEHQALAGRVGVLCRALAKTQLDAREAALGLQELLKIIEDYQSTLSARSDPRGSPPHESGS